MDNETVLCMADKPIRFNGSEADYVDSGSNVVYKPTPHIMGIIGISS